TLVAGSARLFFRYANGSYVSVPLNSIGGNQYRGTLPPGTCAAQPQYYFSAQGAGAGVVTEPANAPTSVHTAVVQQPVAVFSDNFQTDMGWTVQNDATLTTGAWQRGVPAGGGGR